MVDQKEELAKMVLDNVTNIMDMMEDNMGNKVWWAHCFGGMLEYICDKTFSLDYDIDIGVIYGACDENKLINSFVGHGYSAKKMCVNDINGKCFNVHFKPGEDFLKGTPTIDVYFWVPIRELLYHTYDTKKSGQNIPSEYVFKGVKREWLLPSQEVINKESKIGKPGRELMLTELGTWKMPVFGSESGLTMRLPFAIGHLLDTWYSPSWRFREFYKGQSMSRWIKKVKSCKDLK